MAEALSREAFSAAPSGRPIGPALRFVRSLTLDIPAVVPEDVLKGYTNFRTQLSKVGAQEFANTDLRLSVRTTEDGVAHACIVRRAAPPEVQS